MEAMKNLVILVISDRGRDNRAMKITKPKITNIPFPTSFSKTYV